MYKNNHSTELTLNTDIEALNVRILCPKPCTIPPNVNSLPNEIDNINQSCTTPYSVTGNVNAYNPLCNNRDSTCLNHRGKIIEAIPTYISAQFDLFSTIDLIGFDNPPISSDTPYYPYMDVTTT